MQKAFAKSGAFWNWLVRSSADPQSVGMTVKGLTTLGAVQFLFSVLGMFGIHPSFDLNSLGDALYTVTYGGLTLVAAIVAFLGALRKAWNTLFPSQPVG